MPTDFLDLLRRDHQALEGELHRLLDPTATLAQVRAHLDEVRLGLTAHAEAQDIILAPLEAIPTLHAIVLDARISHRHQQRVLSLLVATRPSTPLFTECATELLDAVRDHGADEDEWLLPALRRFAPASEYTQLAGRFATERLRQLAMLQPSAPVFMPFVLERAS